MSFESSSDETSQMLSVEILSLSVSSAESSFAPSPTGILSTAPSSQASSSTSLMEKLKLNVKFAPLPEIAPRKRRSAAPLGIAARSQMTGRRRQQRVIYVDAYQNNPMWTEEELERQRQLALKEGRRRHNQHHLISEEERRADDPFLALGKMVKVAGKSIWRKVSTKEVGKEEKSDGVTEGGSDGKKIEGAKGDESGTAPTVEEEPTLMEQQRYVLKPVIPSEDEEKERGDEKDTLWTISQTETIREGDASHLWITDDSRSSIDDTIDRTPTQSTYDSQ